MDLIIKQELQRILQKNAKVRAVNSCDAPSGRIEGQFYGQTMELQYTTMLVYVQYSSKLQNFELLKDIVCQCYDVCSRINRGKRMNSINFLFNSEENKPKSFGNNFFTERKNNLEVFTKKMAEFVPNENNRIIDKLGSTGYTMTENDLYVFITDESGCGFSEELKKRNRSLSRQSIWFRIDEEKIELKAGLPELC